MTDPRLQTTVRQLGWESSIRVVESNNIIAETSQMQTEPVNFVYTIVKVCYHWIHYNSIMNYVFIRDFEIQW